MDLKTMEQDHTDDYSIYNGDSCELLTGFGDESVHFSIYSPPFEGLYKFSDSEHDLSNSEGDIFWVHYEFIISEIYRLTKPGRLSAVHCMQLPSTITRDGFVGMRDFRGDIIRAHQKCGWIFHSEVCIYKDPVVAMQRTKSLRLLHKQILKDSTMSGQTLADYVVVFRKPGENQEPVDGPLEHWAGEPFESERNRSIDIWQRYAKPVWSDIRQTRTLPFREGRNERDEVHITPLQLDVVERCLELWTNPNDVVLTPFLGIGTEIYVAVEMQRRGLGIELKPSYYIQAVKNLRKMQTHRQSLFDSVFESA